MVGLNRSRSLDTVSLIESSCAPAVGRGRRTAWTPDERAHESAVAPRSRAGLHQCLADHAALPRLEPPLVDRVGRPVSVALDQPLPGVELHEGPKRPRRASIVSKRLVQIPCSLVRMNRSTQPLHGGSPTNDGGSSIRASEASR